MTKPWQNELQRIIGLLLVGLLLGTLFGSLTTGLLVPLTAYLGWHLYNMYRLVRWLRESKNFQPPEASGIWDEAFEQILRLQQRNRKRKRNLRRLLKRFHKITVALPDATVELRPNSDEIEWWNNAASRYLGFEYPRDTGQRISNLIRNPDFLAYLQAGEEEEGEIEMPSPVNDAVTLRVQIIRYSKNRRLLLARDVTRLQRLERTRQDFVANVSHELRSPLTVVAGYLETLLDENVDVTFAAQLRSMQSQTDRMSGIVSDLMLLSRLESEDPQQNITAVAVPEIIDTIIEHAQALDADAGHIIELDMDRKLCIQGHESELYSAFSNLAFNAVRYTPAGGSIIISWKKIQGVPVFSVKDTGAGIAPHHLPRLTERFYRVDTGRSRASGGTGLGLAIVKHVLLRHGGHLEIDSEPGKGSIFSCHFLSESR